MVLRRGHAPPTTHILSSKSIDIFMPVSPTVQAPEYQARGGQELNSDILTSNVSDGFTSMTILPGITPEGTFGLWSLARP